MQFIIAAVPSEGRGYFLVVKNVVLLKTLVAVFRKLCGIDTAPLL